MFGFRREETMAKKRKALKIKGKKQFEFDLTYEKKIFYNLWLSLNDNTTKKINDEHNFGSYLEWRQYFIKKYCEYDLDKLIEFSRYLKQLQRSKKAITDLGYIVITAMFTLIVESGFEIIGICTVDNFFVRLIITLFTIVAVVVPIIVYLNSTYSEMADNGLEMDLIEDCKEIIDDLISNYEKRLNGKDNKAKCMMRLR